jgi:hypothetical protein
MWNCLKQDHFTESYCPQPNIIHFFIVAYSYLANVPVFTMNYDKMLENACEKLNIPFCVCVDALPSETLQNQVIICKLHGNLKEGSGNRVTKNDIKTTMPDIARKNGEWLKYINRFMKTHDMCIWGYSGRDIDYFPFLQEYAKATHKKTFWTIGNPKDSRMDKITEENASLLANVDKTEEYEQNVKFSGSIVGDLSALSIINRDKNPDVALKDARENDNTLNIVKAIFRKKDLINQDLIKKRTTNLTISNEEKKLLLESIMIITPKSLRQTLLDIGKREKLFEVYKGYH